MCFFSVRTVKRPVCWVCNDCRDPTAWLCLRDSYAGEAPVRTEAVHVRLPTVGGHLLGYPALHARRRMAVNQSGCLHGWPVRGQLLIHYSQHVHHRAISNSHQVTGNILEFFVDILKCTKYLPVTQYGHSWRILRLSAFSLEFF